MTPTGTFRVQEITRADRSRAVKRALASGASKVRITEGHRRTILAYRKAR